MGIGGGGIQKLQPGEENDGTFKIFYIFKIREFETFHIWCPFEKRRKSFFDRFLAGRGGSEEFERGRAGSVVAVEARGDFLRFRSARGRPGAPAGSGFMILLPKSFQIHAAG